MFCGRQKQRPKPRYCGGAAYGISVVACLQTQMECEFKISPSKDLAFRFPVKEREIKFVPKHLLCYFELVLH